MLKVPIITTAIAMVANTTIHACIKLSETSFLDTEVAMEGKLGTHQRWGIYAMPFGATERWHRGFCFRYCFSHIKLVSTLDLK